MISTKGFERLIQVFQGSSFSTPRDLSTALESLPPVASMPSASAAWAAIGMVCYRENNLSKLAQPNHHHHEPNPEVDPIG